MLFIGTSTERYKFPGINLSILDQSETAKKKEKKDIPGATSSLHLLEVSIPVFAIGLQDDSDDGHKRFDDAELQSGLLAEAQEPNRVGFPPQAAGAVHTTGPEPKIRVSVYLVRM